MVHIFKPKIMKDVNFRAFYIEETITLIVKS